MVALIGLGYVTSEQKNLAIGLLTLAVGINAATYLGFQVSFNPLSSIEALRLTKISFEQCNHIDLAPNYAGTLMGITNCCANIMSIIAPLVVGLIVKEEVSGESYNESENEVLTYLSYQFFSQSNSDQWRIVFFISAGVYFFGNLLFVIFSKTDVQYWNEPARRSE